MKPALSDLPAPPPGKVGWPWTDDGRIDRVGFVDGGAWPRVSVVTPSFNQAEFLEETMRSVLLQGYPDLEYIVIDGQSTDGSAEIIRKYSPWLAYWVSEPDEGQADAINKGFRRATGEFLAYLNSDDYYYPAFIAEAAGLLRARPAVDLVYRDVDQGRSRDDSEPRRGRSITFPEMLRTLEVPIPQQATLWRRSLVDRVGLFDPKWRVVLDREFFLRAGLHGRLDYVPGAAGFFRLHAGSKSIAHEREWVREVPALYAEFFARPGLSPEIAALKRETMSAAYIFCARIARRCGEPVLAAALIARAIAAYPPVVAKLARWSPGQMLSELGAFFRSSPE